ncbi:MAG: hypothetical protein MZV63_55605 [Marinilabiliales bacterium]|nr:hypothetical protein [Marinilabiliales bacterium]
MADDPHGHRLEPAFRPSAARPFQRHRGVPRLCHRERAERRGNYARVLAAIGVVVDPLNLRPGFYFSMPVFFDVRFSGRLIFWILLRWINTRKGPMAPASGRRQPVLAAPEQVSRCSCRLFCLVLRDTVHFYAPHASIFRNRSLYVASGHRACSSFLPNHHLADQSTGLPVITHMQRTSTKPSCVHVDRVNSLTEPALHQVCTPPLLFLPGTHRRPSSAGP